MAAKKKTENSTVKSVLDAFKSIHETRHLPESVIEGAVAEAMEKAYQKHSGLKEMKIHTVIDNGDIKIYRQKTVVDPVEDEEFEISLEDARKLKPDAALGDTVDVEAHFSGFERSDIALVKSVIKNKIREAEREEVYKRYVDRVGDMVTGVVSSVDKDDRFVLVLLDGTADGKAQQGSTLAMMKKSDQIPTETYTEGQNITVDIIKVDKESKGSIVMVSRADPGMVKRLFEKEVPEIYNGTIEIKAIARDPGLRAKIAVLSHNVNIDPIGACIGPKGTRVQSIIKDLGGEKIDIFQWSDDIQQLVANALAPAQGVTVIPLEPVKEYFKREGNPRNNGRGRVQDDSKSLIAVVPDNQLSLAIGKKGQNAKLAFKLTGHRIDIKSQSEMEEKNINYRKLADLMHEEYEARKAQEHAYKQQKRIEELRNSADDNASIDDVDFTYSTDYYDDSMSNGNMETLADREQETKKSQPAGAKPAQTSKEIDEFEEAARIAKAKKKSLAERKTDYVSKFEAAADAAKPAEKQEEKSTKKSDYHKKDEAVKPWKKTEKKKPAFQQMQPIYTEDELAEIEENEMEEELNASWNEDVDYEEYDSYYDEEY